MALQLLYDYYIKLLTLELRLEKMFQTIFTCTHVRENRLEKAMQDITMTLTTVGRPTLRNPHDGWRWWTSAKLQSPWWCPYYMVKYFGKQILASVASRYTSLAPLSNSFDNMCIIALSVAGLATYWCIESPLISTPTLVVMCINLSKYKSSSSQICAFVFSLLGVPIHGIACACTTTSMLLNTRAWEA